MTLRGYTEYSDGTKSYSLIDSNMRYYVSVSAQNDCYILSGYKFYWESNCIGF